MDEPEILSGLRAGSAEAHEALYDTYAGELYDYCHALLQDADAAAAALRETLLKVAASSDAMPGGCSLRAWLYALARSACRAGGNRMIEHPVPDDDPSALLLITVLGTLTARDREILELTGHHGLSVSDLEPVLGLPPEKVASLTGEARGRFDQAMTEELDRTGPVEYPSLAAITEGGDALGLLFQAIPRAEPPTGERSRILAALGAGAPAAAADTAVAGAAEADAAEAGTAAAGAGAVGAAAAGATGADAAGADAAEAGAAAAGAAAVGAGGAAAEESAGAEAPDTVDAKASTGAVSAAAAAGAEFLDGDAEAAADDGHPTDEIPVVAAPPPRRGKRGLLVGAVGAVVLVAGLVFGITQLGGSERQTGRPAAAPTSLAPTSAPPTEPPSPSTGEHLIKRHVKPSATASPTKSEKSGKRHRSRTGSRNGTASSSPTPTARPTYGGPSTPPTWPPYTPPSDDGPGHGHGGGPHTRGPNGPRNDDGTYATPTS